MNATFLVQHGVPMNTGGTQANTRVGQDVASQLFDREAIDGCHRCRALMTQSR